MLEFGEAELMYDMPRILGGGHIANLGHANGGSAVLMAMCLRELDLEGHIHSVDTFKGNGPTHSYAKGIMEQFDVTDRIILHRGSTDDWAEKLGEEDFDFLFIDADHSYKGVLRDLQNWAPLVKTNGLVGFHDTNQDFSNKVLEEEILDSPYWAECEELHVNRIRVFEKLV
jgi:predicted O-methyltransferase YrrM